MVFYVCVIFQDYSKFMDEEFDVKEWVNNAFEAQKEGSTDVCKFTYFEPFFIFVIFYDFQPTFSSALDFFGLYGLHNAICCMKKNALKFVD